MSSTDDRILQAALKVFEEAGFQGATTRRIAEEAGVNEVTLFRRFGSKDQLLHAALTRGVNLEAMTPLPTEPLDPERELEVWIREHIDALSAMRALIRKSFGEFEAHPHLCAQTRTGPYKVADELSAWLLRLRECGMAPGDWDPHAATALLMGVIFADAMHRDLMPDLYPHDRAQAPAEYARLFLRAINAAPADRRTP